MNRADAPRPGVSAGEMLGSDSCCTAEGLSTVQRRRPQGPHAKGIVRKACRSLSTFYILRAALGIGIRWSVAHLWLRFPVFRCGMKQKLPGGKGSHDYARVPMTESPDEFQDLDDEQQRALIDLAQVYEAYVARAPDGIIELTHETQDLVRAQHSRFDEPSFAAAPYPCGVCRSGSGLRPALGSPRA